MKDVCGDDRPQLFILLEGGAEFHVGVGFSERAGKVTGGLEYLFPAWNNVDRYGLEKRICTGGEYPLVKRPAGSGAILANFSANGNQTFFS